jgi:hypothetical protein
VTARLWDKLRIESLKIMGTRNQGMAT